MTPADGPNIDPDAAAGVLGGTDGFGQALAAWAADAAVDDAARARTRQRWLRLQAEEEATLAGTALDLAERGHVVVVRAGDHMLRGRLAGIGADFVAIATDQGQRTLVPLSTIELLRGEVGTTAVAGDRAPTVDVGLDGLIGVIAADRPDVAIRTTRGTVLRGELTSASPTLLRLRPDGVDRTPTWVPLDHVALLILDP